MDIFYSPYTITPLKRLNRSSTMEAKHGVYLQGKLNGRRTYADYFPHASFGDRGCDHFLQDFHLQKTEYDKKVLYFLLHEHNYHSIPQKTFFNHQLWNGTEDLEAKVIKYKLHKTDDRTFLDPLMRGHKLRIDANGLFNRESLKVFLNSIPKEYLTAIEYLEDPVIEKDWSSLGVAAARDLILGHPYYAYIHRPSCCFYPENETKVIFSSYLGGELGRWHTYCELMEKGDLSEIHGIISKGYFAEDLYFLDGDYKSGFTANPTLVKKIYKDLESRDWKYLCTI